MQKDDELHEVGVSLLPERFPALAEEIVQERGDAVSKGVGVEVVMERIIPVGGIQADLYIILATPGIFEDPFDVMTEVAFEFQDESPDPAFPVPRAKVQQLLGKRVHTAGGLAGSYGAEDGDSGEQSPVGDHQPARVLDRFGSLGVMDFADDQVQSVTVFGFGVAGKPDFAGWLLAACKEDVEQGQER